VRSPSEHVCPLQKSKLVLEQGERMQRSSRVGLGCKYVGEAGWLVTRQTRSGSILESRVLRRKHRDALCFRFRSLSYRQKAIRLVTWLEFAQGLGIHGFSKVREVALPGSRGAGGCRA
jgi:hypothetical protein